MRVAVFWLLVLCALHFFREIGFVSSRQPVDAYEITFILWGLVGYIPVAALLLLRKSGPIDAALIALTLYEVFFTFFATGRGGGWWLIEPFVMAFLAFAFAIPMLLMGWLGTSKTKKTDV